jgi:hypothetical protein
MQDSSDEHPDDKDASEQVFDALCLAQVMLTTTVPGAAAHAMFVCVFRDSAVLT